jgi:hypothetical protein
MFYYVKNGRKYGKIPGFASWVLEMYGVIQWLAFSSLSVLPMKLSDILRAMMTWDEDEWTLS